MMGNISSEAIPVLDVGNVRNGFTANIYEADNIFEDPISNLGIASLRSESITANPIYDTSYDTTEPLGNQPLLPLFNSNHLFPSNAEFEYNELVDTEDLWPNVEEALLAQFDETIDDEFTKRNIEKVSTYYKEHNIVTGAEPLVFVFGEAEEKRFEAQLSRNVRLRKATWFEKFFLNMPEMVRNEELIRKEINDIKKFIRWLNYGLKQNIERENRLAKVGRNKANIASIRSIIVKDTDSLPVGVRASWDFLQKEGLVISYAGFEEKGRNDRTPEWDIRGKDNKTYYAFQLGGRKIEKQ
jgi:hypothetical protein